MIQEICSDSTTQSSTLKCPLAAYLGKETTSPQLPWTQGSSACQRNTIVQNTVILWIANLFPKGRPCRNFTNKIDRVPATIITPIRWNYRASQKSIFKLLRVIRFSPWRKIRLSRNHHICYSSFGKSSARTRPYARSKLPDQARTTCR